MKQYIVIDEFLGENTEVKAENHEDAAFQFAGPQLAMCLSPKLVPTELESNITGAKHFVDEATNEGWGERVQIRGTGPKTPNHPHHH